MLNPNFFLLSCFLSLPQNLICISSIIYFFYFLPLCEVGFFSKSNFCAIRFSHFFSSADSFL